MDLSAANVNDFLRAMGNKPNGEILLHIQSLKSSEASSARQQAVLNELNSQLGIDKGGALAKLIMPKLDVGFNYNNDWKDSCGLFSAEWIANQATLIIKWSGNQGQEGYTRLHSAVARQDVEWVQNLLKSDEWVEVLCSSFSPLNIAEDSDNKEIISLLEDYKTNHAKKTEVFPPPPPYSETETPATTSDRKVLIMHSKLSAAMQSHAIGCAIQALDKCDGAVEIARYIENEFEKTYPKGWNCFVLSDKCEYGFRVTKHNNNYIHFTVSNFRIVLFK